MSECTRCHGTHSVTCTHCEGKKRVTCTHCNGTGKHECEYCQGSGKETCHRCGGSGTEYDNCPVCDHGEVQKIHWVKCNWCHGSGVIYHNPGRETCRKCGGSGEVKEYYKDICPSCHGNYRINKRDCERCGGSGHVTCSECNGTRIVKCDTCSGTGIHDCYHCKGTGKEYCPDCAQREHEQEMRRAKARRRAERQAQAVRKCMAALFGMVWRLAFSAGTGFLFWWWLEGFTTTALPEMLEQVKGILSGISEDLRLPMMVSGGTFVALYVLKLIRNMVLIQILASTIGGVVAAALILSGHWGVGGLMALVLVGAISAKFEGKSHESWWRWLVMGIGLVVSGGFGMNGNWIISSIISFFSLGILLKDEK